MTVGDETLLAMFLDRRKRERFVTFLADPRRRGKVVSSLAHFRDLDARWVVNLPSDRQDAASIERELMGRGAGKECHVVSENAAIDGKRVPLREALDAVVGRGMGTILSCVPGVLAYFEGEGPSDRCILHRRGNGKAT